MATQAQFVVDVKNQWMITKNLEVQIGKIVGALKTRPQGGLPSDTEPNPKQMKAVTTQSGLQLKDLEPNQVNHKAINGEIVRDKEKIMDGIADSKGTRVESLMPPPTFL